MEDSSLYRQAFDLTTQEVPTPTILRQIGESAEVCEGIVDDYREFVHGFWNVMSNGVFYARS